MKFIYRVKRHLMSKTFNIVELKRLYLFIF